MCARHGRPPSSHTPSLPSPRTHWSLQAHAVAITCLFCGTSARSFGSGLHKVSVRRWLGSSSKPLEGGGHGGRMGLGEENERKEREGLSPVPCSTQKTRSLVLSSVAPHRKIDQLFGILHTGEAGGHLLSQEKHLKNYVQLYASLGWDSLVCHSEFLNMFFPEKAAALALDLLIELVQELKMRPCPVVFASFSGGPKACMYKVLQMIDGLCEVQVNPKMGGPYLILCSENDDLAPYQIICNFAQRMHSKIQAIIISC
ncbi:Detected protein of unknown function [Hibiscus syriacus]|uniref:Uncharacterized protein n=1 Tax=Hibiscus syriacus TaxID=106335 RepID=A0A6A3C5Y4_HIBSY|nr:Detected protein of unknown function [Hibiscus syriacus]